MNFAHLHLLLNHFPIIGTMIATGLFVASFAGNSRDLRRSSLITFVGIAVLAIPTFLSGAGAEIVLRGQADVSPSAIQRHEGSAMLALAFMELTGALAFFVLWRKQHAPRRGVASLLFLSLLTVGLMARTGNTGGEIRHREIVETGSAAEQSAEFMARLLEPNPSHFAEAVLSNKWWWALIMDMHFVGLILIVGTAGLLNLRILGFLKSLPLAPLQRLIPWSLAGVAINATTGMIAFLAQPTSYIRNADFWLKIAALLLLALNAAVFYLTKIADQVENVNSGEDAPASAKFVAATSLVLWFAVIGLGRYIHAFIDSIAPPGLN